MLGDGNVIGWNANSGIVVQEALGSTEVIANYVGVTPDGVPTPNGRHGVRVTDGGLLSSGPVAIGAALGTPSTAFGDVENWIGFNGLDGVSIEDGAEAVVRANRVRDNEGLAIDLGENGPTANDIGDADFGANDLQNYPEIDEPASELDPATGDLVVEYRVRSNTSESTYPLTIDFYQADPNTLQPKRLIGSDVYTAADANLQRTAQFPPAVPLDPALPVIVATATDDDGRTSEVGEAIYVPEPDLASSLSGALAVGAVLLGGLNPRARRRCGRLRGTRRLA